MRNGLPEEVAKAIAHLPVLSSACDIVRIATAQKADLEKAAKVYFKAGQHFHLDWLRQQARFMTSEDPWHADATSGLIDQLYDSQAGLTMAILKDIGGQKGKTFEKWLKDHEGRVRQIDRLFVDLRHAGTVDLPMLIIADQRLRGLYAG